MKVLSLTIFFASFLSPISADSIGINRLFNNIHHHIRSRLGFQPDPDSVFVDIMKHLGLKKAPIRPGVGKSFNNSKTRNRRLGLFKNAHRRRLSLS